MFLGSHSDPQKEDTPHRGKPRVRGAPWKFPLEAVMEAHWGGPVAGMFCYGC